jgi:hypothetical protein
MRSWILDYLLGGDVWDKMEEQKISLHIGVPGVHVFALLVG